MIAVTDDPVDQEENPLATQPLWMPKTGNNVVLLPPENGAAVYLAGNGPALVTGAWAVSSLLLLPEGGNLPVGFGIPVDEFFHVTVSSMYSRLNTAHRSRITSTPGSRASGARDGSPVYDAALIPSLS